MSYLSTMLKALKKKMLSCALAHLYYPNKIVMEVESACMSQSVLQLYRLRLNVFKYSAKN